MSDTNPAPDFIRGVGRAIGAIRSKRGWSQEVLADRMGLAVKTIAKLEGGRHDLRLSTVYRVAAALDVTPGDLVDLQPAADESRNVRNRGPLRGLTRSGWKRAKPGAPGAVAVLDLQPRAGKPLAQLEPLQVGWATPPVGRHLHEEGLFVAQVVGDSMEPQIKDGAWCLFSRRFTEQDWLGKHVLVRQTEASGLCAWLVKRVASVTVDEFDGRVIRLQSRNPAYAPLDVRVGFGAEAAVEAVVREVLTDR